MHMRRACPYFASRTTAERNCATTGPLGLARPKPALLVKRGRHREGACSGGARTLANRYRAFATGCRVTWQVIVDLEPRQLFGHVAMRRRRPLRRVVERAVEQVHLARPALARVGHRRSARGAEIALYARRGLVVGRLPFQVTELLQADAQVGCYRRRHSPSAALAMAVHHPA